MLHATFPSPRYLRHIAAASLGLGCGLALGVHFAPWLWSLVLLVLGGALRFLPDWGASRRVRDVLPGLLGGLLAGLLVGSFLLPGRASAVEAVTHYRSTPQQGEAWAGVERLVVRNSAGPLEVSGGEALELSVRYIHSALAQVPGALLSSYAAGRLDFTGVEPALPQGARRGLRAQLLARVPRRVALEFSGRMGDVSAKRLSAVRVHTNLGDVSVSDVSGPVVVSTDVGDVVVAAAGGATEVNTRVGDIWLEPEPGSAPLFAQTDTGNITLVLPPNADVRVIATSLSRGLPPGWGRQSSTRGERVFGQGTRFVVLETRIGKVNVVSE